MAPILPTAIVRVSLRHDALLVGAGGGDLTISPSLLSGRTVTYALEGSSIPQLFLPQLISYWQRGLFPFEKLVRTYALDDINQAEADSLSGATIKPVFLVSAV